jgi:hypothetical protein
VTSHPAVYSAGAGSTNNTVIYHSSDESSFFDAIMEKVKSSKVKYWAEKLEGS